MHRFVLVTLCILALFAVNSAAAWSTERIAEGVEISYWGSTDHRKQRLQLVDLDRRVSMSRPWNLFDYHANNVATSARIDLVSSGTLDAKHVTGGMVFYFVKHRAELRRIVAEDVHSLATLIARYRRTLKRRTDSKNAQQRTVGFIRLDPEDHLFNEAVRLISEQRHMKCKPTSAWTIEDAEGAYEASEWNKRQLWPGWYGDDLAIPPLQDIALERTAKDLLNIVSPLTYEGAGDRAREQARSLMIAARDMRRPHNVTYALLPD